MFAYQQKEYNMVERSLFSKYKYNIQISLVNNSEMCKIKGAKYSDHWFYINFFRETLSPFLWMMFNGLKVRATSRRQVTFYH